MTTRTLNCAVSIGGIDFSAHVVGISREHFICRPVGTATILVDSENAPACNPGDAVTITEMGAARFTGCVSDVYKGHAPATYGIECQDELKRLVEYNFVHEELVGNGETITYWIHHFLGRVGITNRVVAETVDTVPPGVTFSLEGCMEIVRKLCNTQGWQIYADENGTVHVGDFLIPGPPTAISNHVRISDLSDDSWLRNEVVVFGFGGIESRVTTSLPWLGTETRAAVLANPYIRTQRQADDIAAQMAGYFDTPLDTKEIAMEGGARASYLIEDVSATDGYVGYVEGQVTGLETELNVGGYVQTHYLNERCPGFWAMGGTSGSPTGNCFVGHKSAGVYRYNYLTDVATAKNAGLAGAALQCSDLKVDPHYYGDGRRRVWRVTAGGVYKSYDDAETWEYVAFPDPVNPAGDSPAPTVADLTFYGMQFDKLLRGVVYVIAGFISPNDRLWLYKTEDYGESWVSVGIHGHSPVGSGWTQIHANAAFGNCAPCNLTVFGDHLYATGCPAAAAGKLIGVYQYDGVNPPVEVADLSEPVGIGPWATEYIIELEAVGSALYAVCLHMRGATPWLEKVTVHYPWDGTNWTKILDTNTDYGWQLVRGFAAIGVNDEELLVALTKSDGDTFLAGPLHSYVLLRAFAGGWFTDLTGDDLPDSPDYFYSFARTKYSWYPAGPDMIMVADSNDDVLWRQWGGLWGFVGDGAPSWNRSSGVPGRYYETAIAHEGACHLIDEDDGSKIKSTRDADTWHEVDSGAYSCLGVFEGRLIAGNDHNVYIQTLPDYLELDWNDGWPGSGIDFGLPNSFVEHWYYLWATTDKGLWRRDDGRPSWRMNMRRSAMGNQGHQYSVETLPNKPWVVYVAAARESGGNEYIRLLRIHAAHFDSSMSHSFASGSAMGRVGFVRVNAPPNSGSSFSEIVYAFGYGADDPVAPATSELVWRFESGQAPSDKTDITWPGYRFDAIQSLLHDSNDQDWVALFNLGAARGTMNGGNSWSNLTNVAVLTDGADRMVNAIVAGRYGGGANMIRYSPDRAVNWNLQGAGISAADGIASIQMYDKRRFR